MRKAVTLIELTIALTLIGTIILGAMAFDFASKRFMLSSERRITVLNEMSSILDHMHKNIALATGDVHSETGGAMPSIGIQVPNANELRVRQDVNNTPNNYADDVWMQYLYNPVTHTLTFTNMSTNAQVILSSRVTNFNVTFQMPVPNPNPTGQGGEVRLALAVRFQPNTARDPVTNPEVTTVNRATGVDTQIFWYFPREHSYN